MKRSCYCGSLRLSDIGRHIIAQGWVQSKRDMGGVIFIDLRDREGTLQVVFDASNLTKEHFAAAEQLKNESVISVEGDIRHRSEETYNPRIATGAVELKAVSLEVLSEAEPLPFPVDGHAPVRDELRLKYRFLDLRRPAMLQNLRLRQAIVSAAEEYLRADGFLQVETPMLTKSTPEGARDYLVPSRVHPGEFYALPQSPQVFKQLLMLGGIDKYYQVARCFRDEDLRADRQPEFTQIDMELSFVGQEDILEFLEKLFRHIFKSVKGSYPEPFARLTWQQAMDLYGTDKPDLRFDMPITDITHIARGCSFSVFRSVCDAGGTVRALCVKGGAAFTRGTIEELTAKALSYGAKGMAWIAIKENGEYNSILTKYFTPEEMQAIVSAVKAEPGDFILFGADSVAAVRRTLGQLRLDIADIQGLRRSEEYKFLFVTDFPMFEYSETEKRFMAMHHPFTMPYSQDLQYLFSDPARVRSQAYDVVLNGTELGSGSIRIHRRDIQQTVFEALGFSDDEIQKRFGFFVDAFRYGAPPHGGFAFGLDRFTMLLAGAQSLRDVIAFPKLKDASCPLTGAPGTVSAQQLAELSLAASEQSEAVAARKAAVEVDTRRTAALSKLSIDSSQQAGMKKSLEEMAGFASQLLQARGSEQCTEFVGPLRNVLRRDEVIPCESGGADLLAGAPEAAEGCIFVPKVVQ